MNRPPSRSTPAAPGKVRIIGGRWRGTRLDVPAAPGLRPTGDRVRETLFNWLQLVLPGARVLDLFAGSGALGLEALSRGAAAAVLVERDAKLAGALRAIATRLQGGEAASVVNADAMAWLHGQADGSFDIAFVDPPFDANIWGGVLPVLTPKLRSDAWLYVESPHAAEAAPPPEWALHREGHTREVRYALYRRRPAGGADTLAPTPAGPAAASPIERTNPERPTRE
jgi:16S rRNA (guanine966-N2)-methyltransferase